MINCGRGGTIDEAALIRALQNRQIAAAGLMSWKKNQARARQSAFVDGERHYNSPCGVSNDEDAT